MSLSEPAPGCRARLRVAVAVVCAIALVAVATWIERQPGGRAVDVASGPAAVCAGPSHAEGSYCPIPEIPPTGR